MDAIAASLGVVRALIPAIFLLAATPAAAQLAAGDREVVVVTRDRDGDVRERRIGYVLLDGTPYVRTTRLATWGDNVEREGALTLVHRGQRLGYTAARVDDSERLERIHARFREKYGGADWWADRVRTLFGGKATFRLTAPPP